MNWNVAQFATVAEMKAWLIANVLIANVGNVKFIYFDGASGRHVVVYVA